MSQRPHTAKRYQKYRATFKRLTESGIRSGEAIARIAADACVSEDTVQRAVYVSKPQPDAPAARVAPRGAQGPQTGALGGSFRGQ